MYQSWWKTFPRESHWWPSWYDLLLDMTCIWFFKMLYFTFARWWIVDFKTEFSKYYLMMAILVKGWVDTQTITNFGWEAKIRSIQDTDVSWMWVGSLIISCSPNWEVMASILESSKVVVSPVYQLIDFALKSPMTTIKKGISCRKIVQG